MTIQDWGAIGEIVAALGVIGSLLYLSLQIRQNNAYIRAQASHDTLSELREVASSIYSNPELSRIWNQRSGYAEMSPIDRQRLDMMTHALFTVFANYREFGRNGMIKMELVEHVPDALRMWSSEGWLLEQWRSYSRHFFDREFVKWVEGILNENQADR
jgi:hypothetical protein